MYKNPVQIKIRRIGKNDISDNMARRTGQIVRGGARVYAQVLAAHVAVWTGRALSSILPLSQAVGAGVKVPSPTPSEQSVNHKEKAYTGAPEGTYHLPDGRSRRTFTVTFTSNVPYFAENDTEKNDFPSTPWYATAVAELALRNHVADNIKKAGKSVVLVHMRSALTDEDFARFRGFNLNDDDDSEVPF